MDGSPSITAVQAEATADELVQDKQPCLQPVNFLWAGFFFLFADTSSVDLEWSLQGVNKRWLIAH